MNLAELTDDKHKFRQWDVKLVNTLTQINRGYGWAMEKIKECLDKGGDPGEELPRRGPHRQGASLDDTCPSMQQPSQVAAPPPDEAALSATAVAILPAAENSAAAVVEEK